MEITKVIDGDKVRDYPGTHGILAGWGDDNGRWSIDLITCDGYLRFESSNPASDSAIMEAKKILRGDRGIQTPHRDIGICNGELKLVPSIPHSTPTPDEQAFVDYLVCAWSHFPHTYEQKKPKKQWSCTSLEDAAKKYTFNGQTHEDTKKQVGDLSKRLQQCLNEGGESNCHELHHVCLEILEWGGLAGVSSAWLRESCANKTLRCKIINAVCLLKMGPSHRDWKRFNKNDLVMNSGITKIYALADPDNIPIYDGRVGAGLGLQVRKYLCRQCNPRPVKVPAELCFPWKAGQSTYQGRDPSCPAYNFPSMSRVGKNPDGYHAEWCWRAGRIMREAVQKLNTPQPQQRPVSLRDLEDALFMIGYDVQPKVSLCSWCNSATRSGNDAAGN